MDTPTGNKVLVVEDDTELSKFMQTALESENWSVTTAWNGEAAVQRSQELPDLILLDINIEGMHGLQVLAEIRRNPKTADIPVVICSSADNKTNKTRARELGADGFITKPFHLDDLINCVRRMLA